MANLVAISGAIGAGKSEVSSRLESRLRYGRIETRRLLSSELDSRGGSLDRGRLQDYGASLETETDGRWLADRLSAAIANDVGRPGYVVDSVRTTLQLRRLREACRDLKHVHLSADPKVLEERFLKRRGQLVGEAASYAAATAHSIEGEEAKLRAIADLHIDTSSVSPEEVYERVLALIQG